jgi:antitoxin HicB
MIPNDQDNRVSPKLPRITAVTLLRALHRDGWFDVRQSGSHLSLQHADKTRTVTVPRHRGTLKVATLQSILDQAELSVDDLLNLLCGVSMSEREYTIILQPDADEGGYTITVPALPGLVTEGDTLEEAIAMARDAIACHLAALKASGRPIPEELEHPQALTIRVAA